MGYGVLNHQLPPRCAESMGWDIFTYIFAYEQLATFKTQIPFMEHQGLFAWLFLDVDFLYGISRFLLVHLSDGKIPGIQN